MLQPSSVDLMKLFSVCGRRVGLSLLGLSLLMGCRHATGPGAERPNPTVRVVKPIVREITEYAYFTGRMDAVESVDVRSRVTGYLVKINFKPGQDVVKGDLLFKIDPRPYQAAADQARSQIELAKAKLGLAMADYKRDVEIAKTPGAVSQQELDTAGAVLQQAKAELQAAKAASESADLNLEFTDIAAPVDGVIGRPLLTLGNLITQDSTLLTTIVSQDPMYAYFDVDERSMLRYQKMIREGKVKSARAGEDVPVQVGLANEGNKYPHTGSLDFVNNRVDPLTGTIQVRGVFPNPKPERGIARQFTPGLFVRVRLPVGQPSDALLLPQAAIGTDQGRKFVLVVNAKNAVEYRPITVGPEEPDGMQVVLPVQMVKEGDQSRVAEAGETGFDSLTPQDRVIIGGLQKVRPGDQVAVKVQQ
jgi:multidrug efflux system membrane fusion protein